MTVSDFVKTKTEYEAIPVPEELNGRLTETLARGQREARRRRRLHHLLSAASAAAVLCLFAAVNLSAPFAKAMQSLLVVGPVFRVITFDSPAAHGLPEVCCNHRIHRTRFARRDRRSGAYTA